MTKYCWLWKFFFAIVIFQKLWLCEGRSLKMCWAMPHFCCPEYEIFVKWYSKGQEVVEGRYVADYHQDSDNAWRMCSMSKFVIHIQEAQIHEVHWSNSYKFCSFTFLSSTWCGRSRGTIRPERQLFHLAKITTIIVNCTIQSKYIVLNELYPISAIIPLTQD